MKALLQKHPAAVAAVATAVVMAVATWALQRYSMAALEECYILLYDGHFVADTLAQAGGAAQLAASALTQWMYLLWFGPLAVGAIYGAITYMLADIGWRRRAPLWTLPLALLPSVCLFLCLENSSYKFQGHLALLIAIFPLWLSVKRAKCVGAVVPTLLTVLCYWVAGSCAWVTAVGFVLLAIGRRRWWLSLTAPIACWACAATAVDLGAVPTPTRAFTPGMYYEWDTTYYMMLYAWIGAILSIGSSILVNCLSQGNRKSETGNSLSQGQGHSQGNSHSHSHSHSQSQGRNWAALALLAVIIGIAANLYHAVHSPGVYRTQTQRYLAGQGDWDGILALDYRGEATPFTSYRTLALAHKGRLVQELPTIKPFIGYYMQNQTLVKREDLEVLSDIFYDCHYMAAARRYAFDTDIVTPGAFNPRETLKLAAINIAYGDYGVADRLLRQLEKTMRYAPEARRLRAMLHDDAAVEADPVLGAMRRSIPRGIGWTSPRGTARELRHVVQADPANNVAAQFLSTFTTLTGIE